MMILKGSHFPKKFVLFASMKALKKWEKNLKSFNFIVKDLSILKIFNFFPDIFSHIGKWLDKKAKANFKIYDKQLRYTYCPTFQELKVIRN